MANYTPNMNLKKPLTGEYYDVVAEYNNSMDIIDAEVGGVKTSLAQKAKSIDDFQKIIPEVDDTGRIERAFNSGFNIILKHNETYTVDKVRLQTSNIKIFGNNSKFIARNKTSNMITMGRTSVDGFVKVKDVIIELLEFEGIQDATTDSNISSGVNVMENLLERNSGCENITIENCKFSKLSLGVIATGATGIYVKDCSFTNMFFSQPLSAGGYSVLLQSCFDADIYHNKFKALAGDRHAVYSSCVSTANVPNENVRIHDNKIDWSGVLDITGFESCVVLRSHKGCKVTNNIIKDGYGAIRILSSNGNSSDFEIAGNTISGTRLKSGEMADITTLVDAFTLSGLYIHDNNLDSNTPGVVGVKIGMGTDIRVSDNKIKSIAIGIQFDSCSDVKIGGNEFKGCSNTAIRYSANAVISNLKIDPNMFNITGTQESADATSTLTSVIHNYVRTARLRSTGGVVSINENPDSLLASIVSDANGFKVVFNKMYKPISGKVSVIFFGSTPIYTYNRAVSDVENSMTIGLVNPATSAPINFANIATDIAISVAS